MHPAESAPWSCSVCDKDLPQPPFRGTQAISNAPISIYTGGSTGRTPTLCLGRACGRDSPLCTRALIDRFSARHTDARCSSPLRCCWCKGPLSRSQKPVVMHIECDTTGSLPDDERVVLAERRLLVFCSNNCCGVFHQQYKSAREAASPGVVVEEMFSATFCTACCAPLKQPKYCARCRAATYCNRDCQIADWARHSAMCRSNTVSSSSAQPPAGDDA
jgi:hypothetical protein